MDKYTKYQTVVARCSFEPWQIVVGGFDGCYYLQIKVNNTKCNHTGVPYTWSGRKWRLSEHMSETEIVKTALKAVLSAVEHETLENFKYLGESIFDPHMSVAALQYARRHYRLDGRKEPAEPGQDPLY